MTNGWRSVECLPERRGEFEAIKHGGTLCRNSANNLKPQSVVDSIDSHLLHMGIEFSWALATQQSVGGMWRCTSYRKMRWLDL
jgi:hypothetical protein